MPKILKFELGTLLLQIKWKGSLSSTLLFKRSQGTTSYLSSCTVPAQEVPHKSISCKNIMHFYAVSINKAVQIP